MNNNTQPSHDDVESMQWAAIRTKRNDLIKKTDHTQINDSPLSTEKIAEFNLYRKLLRDLPQSFATPGDVVWPVVPE